MRTLSFVGEKSTQATIRSQISATHSYTIQPIITLSGSLLPILYICLKETTGKFGKFIDKSIFRPQNIILSCSKSGKLTKTHVQEFYSKVLLPSIYTESILFLDSWSAQTDQSILVENLGDKKCQMMYIPPGTTALIQPLGVYFFRQWKLFAKRLSHHVILHNMPVDLKLRNNIIKLHSLIHNQMSSSKFKPLIKHAWYKAGYLKHDPGKFSNVDDVCFPTAHQICGLTNCEQISFIICSWCDCPLCFEHFFINFHTHFDSITTLDA